MDLQHRCAVAQIFCQIGLRDTSPQHQQIIDACGHGGDLLSIMGGSLVRWQRFYDQAFRAIHGDAELKGRDADPTLFMGRTDPAQCLPQGCSNSRAVVTRFTLSRTEM